MMFLAVMAALAFIAPRIRYRSLDPALLAKATTIMLIGGWLAGRAAAWLIGSGRGVEVFSPANRAPGSLTFFLLGASVALVVFLFATGANVFTYVDALAPSAFLGLAVAKIGCLLAGCCAGDVCASVPGITYPYGSLPYEHQYRAELLPVPAGLVRSEKDSAKPLWPHAQLLTIHPEIIEQLLVEDGLPAARGPEIVARAQVERSLPVLPLPLLVSAAALAGWLLAEVIYRKSQRTGETFAFVLAGYGVIRLTLDWLLPERGVLLLGLSAAQWLGVVALLLSAAIFFHLRRPSRRRNFTSHT